MQIACLDTESTSTGKLNEILELAIFDAGGRLLLNSLFKPKHNKKWPHSEKVHGISPLMVKDKPYFHTKLSKIQKIFDKSQMVLGFALNNDIALLEKAGVSGLVPEKCLDVRELFWAVYGKELNIDLFHIPKLVTCAEYCGYEWEEGTAHSAAADAKATLFCYRFLMRAFLEKYKIALPLARKDILLDREILSGWQFLQHMVAEELYKKEVEKAKGWLYLFHHRLGYFFICRKKPLLKKPVEAIEAEDDKNSAEIVVGIYLQDFIKGYEFMQEKFAANICNRIGKEKVYYSLTKEDIMFFTQYTNTFA